MPSREAFKTRSSRRCVCSTQSEGVQRLRLGSSEPSSDFSNRGGPKPNPRGKFIFIQRKKICHGEALRQQEDFVTRCAPRGAYNSPSAGTDAASDQWTM